VWCTDLHSTETFESCLYKYSTKTISPKRVFEPHFFSNCLAHGQLPHPPCPKHSSACWRVGLYLNRVSRRKIINKYYHTIQVQFAHSPAGCGWSRCLAVGTIAISGVNREAIFPFVYLLKMHLLQCTNQ